MCVYRYFHNISKSNNVTISIIFILHESQDFHCQNEKKCLKMEEKWKKRVSPTNNLRWPAVKLTTGRTARGGGEQLQQLTHSLSASILLAGANWTMKQKEWEGLTDDENSGKRQRLMVLWWSVQATLSPSRPSSTHTKKKKMEVGVSKLLYYVLFILFSKKEWETILKLYNSLAPLTISIKSFLSIFLPFSSFVNYIYKNVCMYVCIAFIICINWFYCFK